MTLRTIPRAAVTGSISLARWPADAAIKLVTRDSDRSATPRLMLDRIDASARDLAGSVMGDDVLKRDAARRRVAADQRERALELREEAGERLHEVREGAAERKRKAQRIRHEAAEVTAKREDAADQIREREEDRNAKAQQRKRITVRKQAAAKRAASAEQAREQTAEQLRQEAAALAKKEDALTVEDEAHRLHEKAEQAKAARKSDE